MNQVISRNKRGAGSSVSYLCLVNPPVTLQWHLTPCAQTQQACNTHLFLFQCQVKSTSFMQEISKQIGSMCQVLTVLSLVDTSHRFVNNRCHFLSFHYYFRLKEAK